VKTTATLTSLLLGALLLGGCTVGADPADPATGTGLEPTMGPAKKKSRQPSRSDEPERGERPDRRNEPSRPAVTPRDGKSSTAPDGPGPGASSSPTAEPADGVLSASVADGQGDVTGLGAPAFADLTGATVVRDGQSMTVTVEAAAAFPTSSEDRTMNVIVFVDTGGDGQVDYEMWGTLADNGWSGTWRNPDGATFGSASGVLVSPEGARLRLTFPAGHVGGAESFRWAVGAEHGTFEQQATGTMSEDYAPDSGAARFPAP
jgi:hypothetical protein